MRLFQFSAFHSLRPFVFVLLPGEAKMAEKRIGHLQLPGLQNGEKMIGRSGERSVSADLLGSHLVEGRKTAEGGECHLQQFRSPCHSVRTVRPAVENQRQRFVQRVFHHAGNRIGMMALGRRQRNAVPFRKPESLRRGKRVDVHVAHHDVRHNLKPEI